MSRARLTYADKRRKVLAIYRKALRTMGVPAFVVRELRTYGPLKSLAVAIARSRYLRAAP